MNMAFLVSMLWHLLYDFHWQGDFIAKNKGKSWVIMTVHCLTWTLGLYLIVGTYREVWLPSIPFLFCGHYVMDLLKVRVVDKYEAMLTEKFNNLRDKNNSAEYNAAWAIDEAAKTRYYNKLLLVDQLWHVLQIFTLIITSDIKAFI